MRLIDPVENREDELLGRRRIDRRSIDDPVLARSGCSTRPGSRSRGLGPDVLDLAARDAAARAPGSCREPTPMRRRSWTIGRAIHAIFFVSSQVPSRFRPSRETPEEWTIPVDATEPGWVIVSQLADPQWKARWINLERSADDAADDPAGVSQRNELGGLAVHRNPRCGPLDLTAGIRSKRCADSA